jgi:hypothetical protein
VHHVSHQECLAHYYVEPVTIEKPRWLLGRHLLPSANRRVGELRSRGDRGSDRALAALRVRTSRTT